MNLPEPFVVRHYSADERPTIKGNGFDGLEVGETREEAEAFVAFVNNFANKLPEPYFGLARRDGGIDKAGPWFTADQLLAYAAEAIRLEREACLEAVLFERLGDAPECSEDTAYNNAIYHAAAAIRARFNE